ncbi:MAG: MlaD family protein [Fimbriiglobus sp.]|jgi:hypothetical protein|nr:MlaD family protein [Fimbriiglobus sp.]
MTSPLTRRQSVLLGLVVLLSVALFGIGVLAIGGKQGLFADRTEVTVWFRETHDITPGTSVRVRGVEAGHVAAVEFPDADSPAAGVLVRMRMDRRFAERLFADATARAFSPSPLGAKVIALDPGSPAAGPLHTGEVIAIDSPDLGNLLAKLDATAADTQALLKDVRAGKGSLGKLLTDDTLYDDLSGLTKESRGFLKRADGAVQTVEKKAADVDQLVADGRGAIRSARQSADAVQTLPLIRNYVVNADRVLNRPDREAVVYPYSNADLFEGDTIRLSEGGRQHLSGLAEYLRKLSSKVEVVIVGVGDPKAGESSAAVRQTEQQAAAVLRFLESEKAFKTSWVSSRKATSVGLGNSSSPLGDGSHTAHFVQVVMFAPR